MPSIVRHAITALATSAALAAVSAAPAAAAPLTIQTDADTTCTINASKQVGAGLLGISPIDFEGEVGCSLADQARAPIYEGSASLTADLLGIGDVLPLGLGNISGAGAQPNSPSNVEGPPLPPNEPAPFVCRLDPGYDCGSTGHTTGLPSTPYQVIHFGTFTAPAGEIWDTVPEGCAIAPTEGDEAGSVVSCVSRTELFTTAG